MSHVVQRSPPMAPQTGTVAVWDLWRIRKRLQEIGLDWDLPADSPAAPTDTKPLRVEVDLGDLALERLEERAATQVPAWQREVRTEAAKLLGEKKK